MHISHVNDATVIIWSTFVVRFKGCPNLSVPIQGALPYVSSLSSFFAFPFLWSSTCRRDPAHGFSSSTSVEENNYKKKMESFANLELGGFCWSSSGCPPKHCEEQGDSEKFLFVIYNYNLRPMFDRWEEEPTCHRHSQTQGERHAWDQLPLQPVQVDLQLLKK